MTDWRTIRVALIALPTMFGEEYAPELQRAARPATLGEVYDGERTNEALVGRLEAVAKDLRAEYDVDALEAVRLVVDGAELYVMGRPPALRYGANSTPCLVLALDAHQFLATRDGLQAWASAVCESIGDVTRRVSALPMPPATENPQAVRELAVVAS